MALTHLPCSSHPTRLAPKRPRAHAAAQVCQYMYYKLRWTGSSEPTPEFKVDPEEALELCMAADFLEC